jgi:hypothetical protein
MKEPIEQVVALAKRFWATDSHVEALDRWEKGLWLVDPLGLRDEGCLQIAVLGPNTSGTQVRADIFVYPRESIGDSKGNGPIDTGGSLSRIPTKLKGIMVGYANCKLFWPGPHDSHRWTRGQLGVYFLQRGWAQSDDASTWVWEECVVPLFKSSKAGREALASGVIGYERLGTMVRTYVNPSRPGSFRAYIRATIKRAALATYKARQAEVSESLGTAMTLRDRDSFFAFLRQRRSRGQLGVILYRGRLTATQEVLSALLEEWIAARRRRRIVRGLAARMVQAGANEESARRQVRRWRNEAGTERDAIAHFERWRKRKQRASETRAPRTGRTTRKP